MKIHKVVQVDELLAHKPLLLLRIRVGIEDDCACPASRAAPRRHDVELRHAFDNIATEDGFADGMIQARTTVYVLLASF